MQKQTRFWLKVHFYSGLTASIFLLIIGISALHYNHRFNFLKPHEKFLKEWHQDIQNSDTIYNNETLNNIKNELNIFGYCPVMEQYYDSTGNYHFLTIRLGKRYFIELINNTKKAKILEYNTGIGEIITGLHTSSVGSSTSKILKVWKWFANICIVLAFITIITSTILWYKRSFKKKRQWFIVFILGGLSIFYILFIWLIG